MNMKIWNCENGRVSRPTSRVMVALGICILAYCAAFAAHDIVIYGSSPAAGPVATAECQGNSIRLFSEPLAYEVSKDGKVVVPRTEIGLCVDGKELCRGAKVSKPVVVSPLKQLVVEAPVYKKDRIDIGREERLVDFGDDFAVRLVARPDGVAYRFELKKGGVVADEKADLTIPKNARCWFNRTSRKAMEGVIPQFADATALKNEGGKMFFLPFVYSVEGKTVAVMDTDVHDYPVWNFGNVEQTEVGAKLKSFFAKYPKSTELSEGGKRKRFIHVRSNENFIAKATAPRTLPWRVVEHFAKLGAKGFKVDFMDRGDADVYAFLEKFAAVCAKHRMVVDYHGSCRPAGLHRTYPNILNFEAIHGLEQMKWAPKSKDMCPNDVAVFFLRMTDGPMDYTPGAMDNYPIGDYRGNGTNPQAVDCKGDI